MTIPRWQKAMACQQTYSQYSQSIIQSLIHTTGNQKSIIQRTKIKYWDTGGNAIGRKWWWCLGLRPDFMGTLYEQVMSCWYVYLQSTKTDSQRLWGWKKTCSSYKKAAQLLQRSLSQNKRWWRTGSESSWPWRLVPSSSPPSPRAHREGAAPYQGWVFLEWVNWVIDAVQ